MYVEISNVNSFYWKKYGPHSFLFEAITQIEQDTLNVADFVLVRPRPGGLDSDVKGED